MLAYSLVTLAEIAKTVSTGKTSSTRVVVWWMVLLAVLVAGFVIITQLKRRLRDDEPPIPGAATGFTLSDIRQLHRDGQMTDEEFERAKAKIIEAAKKVTHRDFQRPPAGSDIGDR